MGLQQHFEQVRQLIRRGQGRALQAAYAGQLTLYWQVGAYVYYRLQHSEWGDKTIEELAIWLKEQEPTLKGFDRRSLYRMKEFFQTWHELDWKALKKDGTVIVVTLSPQMAEFPNILASLNWSRESASQCRYHSPDLSG
jgi:hypothetical protein